MRPSLTILALLAVTLLAACSSKSGFPDITDAQFKVGQVWTYQSRPWETNSTLTVCKVENAGKFGKVVHVVVGGVKLKSPRQPGGMVTEMHLPFAIAAVQRSVGKVIAQSPPPVNYQSGYAAWHKAVKAGKGGVWNVSVAEALTAMEKSMNK